MPQESEVRTRPVAWVAVFVALSLTGCSYSAIFAVANGTPENATVFLVIEREGKDCPPRPHLATAPVGELRPRWFRPPSPDWSTLPWSSFVYSNLDCSLSVSLPARRAVSLARVSNTLINQAAWAGHFPITRLSITSASHHIELESREQVLASFEKRAELLYVLEVARPAA